VRDSEDDDFRARFAEGYFFTIDRVDLLAILKSGEASVQ